MLLSSLPTDKVEADSYCRKTITARIQEQHYRESCKVSSDVSTFRCEDVEQGSDVLDGLMGGFPCQVRCEIHKYSNHVYCAQGSSRAGSRFGLDDPRTSLLKHFFRCWDDAKDPSLG